MAHSVVYACCILVYDVITISTLCPRKNYNPVCIANSGEQRRILTKFCSNTETLNYCKQVTKFPQNRSTSATATAGLVRSLSTIGTRVIDCQVCVRANGKTSPHHKVCVQNVHRLLEVEVERKLQDVDATAWPLYRWPPGGNVPTLRSGETSAGRRHESGCGTHDPAASTKSGSRLG